MNEPILRCCPFCGGDAEISESRGGQAQAFGSIFKAACRLRCCAESTWESTREEAAEWWNRRAPELHSAESLTLSLRAENERLRGALAEGRRAIGDHWAPNDCYATGPVTGNAFRDLVECPACSFIAKFDALSQSTGDTK